MTPLGLFLCTSTPCVCTPSPCVMSVPSVPSACPNRLSPLAERACFPQARGGHLALLQWARAKGAPALPLPDWPRTLNMACSGRGPTASAETRARCHYPLSSDLPKENRRTDASGGGMMTEVPRRKAAAGTSARAARRRRGALLTLSTTMQPPYNHHAVY